MKSDEVAGKALQAEGYRLLVDAIIDYAVYMLDPSGVVVSWNPGAQRFKGYTADEILGSHFSLFYTETDREAGLPARGLDTAATKGRFETEGWRVRKDGTRFMAHVIIDAIYADNGELTGFAKVTRDVTERYEAQQALDKAREELFQAQKMEAVGRLTGGVAHDFNNLLTIILISLNLARKRLTDSPVLSLIDNAIQGAERGATMTQRMLAFSRKQSLQLEAISLPDLVAGMSTLVRQSVASNINVDTRLAPGLPCVEADRHQLETALLNLVFNARDAMPDGGTVTISARLPSSEERNPKQTLRRQCVLLEVSDSGVGMDKATLEQAIEPFFTTKGVGKGTGLGLSMVHGIVEQLNGTLKLYSTKGQGTTVQLWLPIAASDFASADRYEEPPHGADIGSLRVLVVDDDELVLTNTCALLEEMGHQVLQAQSAQHALRILEDTPVDLLLTDHAMPGMTGSQLAERLAESHPSLPVILASGYAQVVDNTDPIPTLAKPFDETSLAQAIVQAVTESQA